LPSTRKVRPIRPATRQVREAEIIPVMGDRPADEISGKDIRRTVRAVH
jgi:hypothetical protein